MLLSLSIRNFVIVEHLELEFGAGFTVLTGETGAGKSILLDALGLLLGGRSDGAWVRHGEKRAELAARFRVSHMELERWLLEHALDNDDGELLLRRVQEASGRSKNFINGQPVTLAQLKSLGEFLVDIHGQHAHQSLLKHDAQRRLLDAYADAQDLSQQVSERWHDWQAARRTRLDAEKYAHDYQVECERLDWQIQELSELDPKDGEWEQLGQLHSRLAHANELIDSADYGRYVLSDGDNNALDIVAQVQTRLGRLAHYDARLNEALTMLASAEAELREAAYALRDYVADVERDPQALAQLEHRIEKLHDTARKYRVMPEELPQKLEEWQAARANLERTANIEELIARETETEIAYREYAEQLSLKRQRAAVILGERVSAEMHTLAMQGARFAVELPPLATPSQYGLENVEYLVSANTGMSLRPLAKVASGGELSRISLALQVVMSQIASVPTLIFDEVDVGIGGRVAEVVGRKLRQLAETYQVLCVTHLPQVAAFGQHHWQVSKQDYDGHTTSRITVLDVPAREDELARMLGGECLTETTRRHAVEMLKNASQR